MKKAEIVVGNEYLAKVSGQVQRVRIERAYEYTYRAGCFADRHLTRWKATNLATDRVITIKSAQRLRPIGGK